MKDGAGIGDYHERLRVPLRWWAQWTMMVASLWIAMIVAIPDNPFPWIASAVAFALMALCLFWYGDARIAVADGRLRAGRARIEVGHIGSATALDDHETWRVAGPDADARAFLLLRPYLRRAVRIDLIDPADPTPYWLISSRHPEALAGAVNAARSNQLG